MVDARNILPSSEAARGIWLVGAPWFTIGVIMSLYFLANRDYEGVLVGVAIAIAGVARSYVWLKGARSFAVEVSEDLLKLVSKGVLHEYEIRHLEQVELHKGSSPVLIMTGPIYDLPFLTLYHKGEKSTVNLFLLFECNYIEFVKRWDRESISPLRVFE